MCSAQVLGRIETDQAENEHEQAYRLGVKWYPTHQFTFVRYSKAYNVNLRGIRVIQSEFFELMFYHSMWDTFVAQTNLNTRNWIICAFYMTGKNFTCFQYFTPKKYSPVVYRWLKNSFLFISFTTEGENLLKNRMLMIFFILVGIKI